jgi:hypothetical protein
MESKFWCFTLNNPSEDVEQSVTDFLSSRNVSYGIFGREIGETGTPHLQGFVILDRSRRLSYLRRKFQAHWSQRHGNSTNAQARDYCKKDGDFEEFGTFTEVAQGRRHDLDQLVQWADEFTEENGRPPTSPDIAKHQPRAYLRYPRFAAMCAHRAPQRQLEFGEPNNWQQYLVDELSNEADDRTIKFIIDNEGGKGKTWFCRWMLTNNHAVQVLGVGKKADLAYMLDESKHIFLFNIGRGQMEFLSYPLLEALKDRLVTSTKYRGMTKMWSCKVHVVVLGNEQPDLGKMTEDRYDIVNL